MELLGREEDDSLNPNASKGPSGHTTGSEHFPTLCPLLPYHVTYSLVG